MQPEAPVTGETVKKGGFWRGVKEWVQVIVIALAIALPVRFFIAEPFVVNGASMDPTFSTGQFLIVDRLSYRFGDPRRGDVVVFAYPKDPSVYYIKRVIGLPGETVSLTNGHVSISGGAATSTFTLAEPYVSESHSSRETVVEKRLGAGEYFVMGDNRAQSSDSRVWGPLDRKFVVGRPIVRLTPLSAISFLPGEYNEASAI